MSYWLMPDQQSEPALERLSDCAQQQMNGCRLPPHITLYSDHLDSPERAIERLVATADQQPPIRLQPQAIEAGALFTQSLVIRFSVEAREQAAHAALQTCCEHLRQRSANALGYRLDPHLSLLYSHDALPIRQACATALIPPATCLRFDRISAVSHPLRIQTIDDIAAFTTLTTQQLN
ncbi:hypothetical protein SynNOUM97013_01768 [Synechococcus sp. NOUM97013]|nr:hypothetical protein SynNOUM97013_01768 [Synechococcus sp. NOUM97013]